MCGSVGRQGTWGHVEARVQVLGVDVFASVGPEDLNSLGSSSLYGESFYLTEPSQ